MLIIGRSPPRRGVEPSPPKSIGRLL